LKPEEIKRRSSKGGKKNLHFKKDATHGGNSSDEQRELM
jgi:hypothetical protein